MFVTCVQLLSAAWGMSCCAAKHYTQQPTLLSPGNTSFFHSISVTSFCFISDFVYFFYVPCLSLPAQSTLWEEADRLCFVHITHPNYMGHLSHLTNFYLFCWWFKLEIRQHCHLDWSHDALEKTNTACICLFPPVLSGCIVTWQLRNREIMNYLVK